MATLEVKGLKRDTGFPANESANCKLTGLFLRPSQSQRIFFFWLILVAAGFASRCENPFAMRKAEEPDTGQSVWEPARSPSQLLDNFSKSISDRDADQYKRCLVDTAYSDRTFRFDPDPAVQEIYPALFEGWSTGREEEVMRQAFQLVPEDSISQLIYTQDVHQAFASDSAEYIRQYRLELHHSQEDLPNVFEGQIYLRMTEDARGEWVIYFWNDRNVFPEKQGWSDLKAELGG